MFGLPNHRGSCWVNAALQGLFSCPVLEDQYSDRANVDKENPTDICLESVYRNKGSGLKDLFEVIKTSYMPAGENIGDSHELITHLCDKLPWLDKGFRFDIGDNIKCMNCPYTELRKTSTLDIHLMPSRRGMPLLEAIQEHVRPITIDEWKCEKCQKLGCTKQLMFGTFPKVFMIWSAPIEYSSLLILNGKKYYLFAVICFNGGHWWTYGRKLPAGKPWHVLDDTTVREMDSRKFPVDSAMRVLLYFLCEN